MTARSMFRALVLVLAASVVPATAFADDTAGARPGVEKRGERGERASFPMTGGAFIAHVEQRITKTRARVEQAIGKRNLTPEQKAQVMAELDGGAAQVRAAAQKANADGVVTREEAKAVRDVAHQAKDDLRAKAGLKEHGKDREKGQRGEKGRGREDGKGREKGKGQERQGRSSTTR